MVRNLGYPDKYIRIIFLAITDFCSFWGSGKKISKSFFERTTYPFTTNEVIDTITGIHIIMLGYTYINQQYYSTVGISMYDSILYYSSSTVRYITSISYNTNTGNTLCNAPDVQHRIYGLYSSYPS